MGSCPHNDVRNKELDGDEKTGHCFLCMQDVHSFYIEDEDRRGWSRWKLIEYVIHEEREAWSELNLSII